MMLGYRYFAIDPSLDQARQGFMLSIALIMITFAFLYSRIQKAAQTTRTVTVKNKTIQGEVEETQTFMQYDTSELFKLVKQTLIGSAVVIGIHLWKGYTQPLVFQALMLPMTALDHQLFHIYILGRPASGDLERPWKEENPFAAFQQQTAQNAAETRPAEDGHAGEGSKKAKKEAKKQK